MIEQYYIKKPNGRYRPVERFDGFPSDGVWMVKDAGALNQLILKLSHKPISTAMVARKAVVVDDLKTKILSALEEGPNGESWDMLANRMAEKLVEGME